MVIRLILRYFANNEQLVQKLAESYPMRRTAQIMVAAFLRTKSAAEQRGLNELTADKFLKFLKTFQTNVKQEIEGVKQELKKKN